MLSITGNLSICDNKNLPSYEKNYYKGMRHKWEFVDDMFQGRDAWVSVNETGFIINNPLKASRYLPCEADEPGEEYLKRLARSYFERFFRNAIENFAGFLSSFVLDANVDKSIASAIDDIDLLGNNLEIVLKNADIKSLKDDHCFILVEFPKQNPNILTAYDENVIGNRPYLVVIDCRNVINWKLSEDKKTIKKITIREIATIDDGEYGEEEVVRYRVLTPGYYQVFEINGEPGKEYSMLIDQGETSLDFIPIVPYSLFNTDKNPFEGEPPLYDLAELNLKHYQKTSEKDEVMHRCNLPVLVINELQQTRKRSDEPLPTISLGPNTCLWNVDAKFVEPSGSALIQTQADIERLEKTMLERTLSFLSGNEIIRTATEVVAHSTPVESNLESMARAKQSAVELIFRYWVAYYKKSYGGTIKVDEKVLKAAMDSQTFSIIDKIYENGSITKKTYLNILQRGKILPSDLNIEEELEELEEEKKESLKSLSLTVPEFGNDENNDDTQDENDDLETEDENTKQD